MNHLELLYKSQTLEAASQLKSWDKLTISVPWHPSSSRNQQFPQQAQKLWKGTINTDTALAYDASVALIEAIKIQQQPSHEGMQQALADPNFTVTGGTGVVKFGEDGDRQNLPSELVHIVKRPKQQFGLAFVPIKYPTAAAAGLKCDRTKVRSKRFAASDFSFLNLRTKVRTTNERTISRSDAILISN